LDAEDTGDLNIGDLAPDVRLPSGSGNEVALADYRGKAHVVLFFVRAYQ
jgi:peroxiredoxin